MAYKWGNKERNDVYWKNDPSGLNGLMLGFELIGKEIEREVKESVGYVSNLKNNCFRGE